MGKSALVGILRGLQITIIRKHCHFIFYDDLMCYALTLEYDHIFFHGIIILFLEWVCYRNIIEVHKM